MEKWQYVMVEEEPWDIRWNISSWVLEWTMGLKGKLQVFLVSIVVCGIDRKVMVISPQTHIVDGGIT
jgi:hypothetical protein